MLLCVSASLTTPKRRQKNVWSSPLTLYMPSYRFPSSGEYLLCLRPLQLRTTLTGLPSFQFLASAPFLSLTGMLQLRATALVRTRVNYLIIIIIIIIIIIWSKKTTIQKSCLLKKEVIIMLCPLASYRFMWVSVWSHDCSAVLLFPERSRPPEPV